MKRHKVFYYLCPFTEEILIYSVSIWFRLLSDYRFTYDIRIFHSISSCSFAAYLAGASIWNPNPYRDPDLYWKPFKASSLLTFISILASETSHHFQRGVDRVLQLETVITHITDFMMELLTFLIQDQFSALSFIWKWCWLYSISRLSAISSPSDSPRTFSFKNFHKNHQCVALCESTVQDESPENLFFTDHVWF